MAVQVGWSVAESRGAQAGARVGTGMAGTEAAGTEADATGVGAGAVLSGLAAEPVPPRLGLPGRLWRSWLRHWVRYADGVGGQWR